MIDDINRSETKRLLGGVCAGIADSYGVSVWVVRLIFVLMFVPGVPLYLFLWASTPSQHATQTTGQ